MGFGNHTSNYFHAVLLQYFTSELVLWVSCSVHCRRDHHGCGGGGGGLGWVEVWNGHLHPNKSDAFPVAFPGVVITAWSSLLVSQAKGHLHKFLWPLQSYCAGSWEFSLHPCYHIIIIIISDNILPLLSLQGWCTIIEKDIMTEAITALTWNFLSLLPVQIVIFPREKGTVTQLIVTTLILLLIQILFNLHDVSSSKDAECYSIAYGWSQQNRTWRWRCSSFSI